MRRPRPERSVRLGRSALAAVALAGALVLSACVGAGGPGAGAPADPGAGGDGATAEATGVSAGTQPDGSSGAVPTDGTTSGDPGTNELFEQLVAVEEFPRGGFELLQEKTFEDEREDDQESPVDDGLAKCTYEAVYSASDGRIDEGAGRQFVQDAGVTATGVSLTVLSTDGVPSEDNALAKWQTFAERIRACTDAPMKEIGTGGATGTTESIDLTKDLAPEENGGVGLLCFAALQLSPVPMDDGETVAPEYSSQCVAANENRMVLMHALYWVASSEAPTADTLTWVRGTAWDAFVLQGEKIGVTVEEGA